MKRVLGIVLLYSWLLLIVFIVVAYFFFPDIYFRMTNYTGINGPFVNTPRG